MFAPQWTEISNNEICEDDVVRQWSFWEWAN